MPDLSKLTPQAIAALTASVGLVAALIAAVASLVVATVNGSYARRVQRDGALREYKLRLLRRMLRLCQRQSKLFAQLIAVRAQEHGRGTTFLADSVQDARRIRQQLLDAELFNGADLYLPAIAPSKRIKKALDALYTSHHQIINAINLHESDPDALARVHDQFKRRVSDLRSAIELDIFFR